MKKSIVAAIVIVGVVFGLMAVFGPIANVKQKIASGSIKWTQEAIEKDPDGYAKFLEKSFKYRIETFEIQRKDVSTANAELQREIEKRQSDLEKSEPIFDDLLAALDKGEFPVTIYGAQYDEQELRSQINVVMNERESARSAIANFANLRNQGNRQQEILIARITVSRDQLAMLDAKRNLFKTSKMTEELSKLVADMTRAFNENEKVAASNSVGSLKELVERAEIEAAVVADASDERIDAALEAYRAKKREALLKDSEDAAPDEDETIIEETDEEEILDEPDDAIEVESVDEKDAYEPVEDADAVIVFDENFN